VLALEFVSTICAFAVLEGPERLVEWGTRGITSEVSDFLSKLEREVLRYRPDVIVVEDAGLSRKGKRVQDHLAWVEQWAADHDHQWQSVARPELQDWGAHLGTNKELRASALSELFPELQSLVPPPRKIWQAEAKRLSVFVAIERALCFYESGSKRDSKKRIHSEP